MSVAYIAYADEDKDFVHDRLLGALPVLGFDRWLSNDGKDAGAGLDLRAACGVFLIVVSSASARSALVRRQSAALMKTRGHRPVLVQIDDTSPEAVASELGVLAVARAKADGPIVELADLLKPFLPPARELPADARIRDMTTPIQWNEAVFSTFLQRALAHQDFSGCVDLVERLSRHLTEQKQPYGAKAAQKDLGLLRKRRQFPLMDRYARAVLDSGTQSFNVLRQYAQSLIELGSYAEAEAEAVLGQIVTGASTSDIENPESEYYEARGLLGRIYKQQYVNKPGPSASDLLKQAIHEYREAFRKHPQLTWHGINAATCLVRAEQDGLKFGSQAEGRALAGQVLDSLAAIEKKRALAEKRALYAFELATRVEAWALLGEFNAANEALTTYLADPDAHAFEVSSTHRQFEQVLRLDRHREGKELVDRLWDAVERLRAPLGLRSAAGDTREQVSVLITTMAAGWKPAAPGCDVCGRLGPMVAVTCDRGAIKALLSDPRVLAIDESRKAMDTTECATALPFINCVAPFQTPSGPFQEEGTNAIVAVIDEGIDVLHEAFLDQAGESRIIGVWDQRDETGPAPSGFTFGTYHSESAIAGYVKAKTVPPKLGRDVDGHGTHVASIAAGRVAGTCPQGVAPDARLLIVIADSASSIGYSNEHLAALDFIDQEAEQQKLPVVVNVSQGMNAGPHDGFSPLENAFDAFSNKGSKGGRVIVKSAGNAGDANGHAVIKHGRRAAAVVQWTRFNNPGWQYEYLEFWWDSANTYRFVLVAPNGDVSEAVESGRLSDAGQIAGSPYRMRMSLRDKFNGDAQLVVEIGSASDNAIPVTAGAWQLQVQHLDGDAPGVLDGWIERGPKHRSVFHAPHASPDMTLTIPGTALSVITVGAISVKNNTITATNFTSFGPTRDKRNKPEVCAPGQDVFAAKGGTSQGAFASTGTSMAAPFVAGAVALVLSRALAKGVEPPTAAQIRKVLEQKTKNRGPWDSTQGFGVIDVAAVLAAF